MSRKANQMQTTRRLIILAAVSLAIIGIIFGINLFLSQKFMVSWLCLMCGILGGFVSIQQRLPKVSGEELSLLSGSWFQVLLIPIYGGIFSLVLYVIFLSGIISGHFFPAFSIPPIPETGVDSAYIKNFITNTYPASGTDLAKLIVWCFIAGFSERFVPQIITNVADKKDEEDK
jgi:hypothetical protein